MVPLPRVKLDVVTEYRVHDLIKCHESGSEKQTIMKGDTHSRRHGNRDRAEDGRRACDGSLRRNLRWRWKRERPVDGERCANHTRGLCDSKGHAMGSGLRGGERHAVQRRCGVGKGARGYAMAGNHERLWRGTGTRRSRGTHDRRGEGERIVAGRRRRRARARWRERHNDTGGREAMEGAGMGGGHEEGGSIGREEEGGRRGCGVEGRVVAGGGQARAGDCCLRAEEVEGGRMRTMGGHARDKERGGSRGQQRDVRRGSGERAAGEAAAPGVALGWGREQGRCREQGRLRRGRLRLVLRGKGRRQGKAGRGPWACGDDGNVTLEVAAGERWEKRDLARYHVGNPNPN